MERLVFLFYNYIIKIKLKRGFKLENAKFNEFDILKGMALLALVLQHTIAGTFYQPDINEISLNIGTTFLGLIRFAVPLFIFITGLVLFHHYGDKLEYKSYYKKGLIQIIVPYIAWTAFYFIWTSLINGSTPMNTYEQFKTIINLSVSGQAAYHLWFMVIIIAFYLLFPIFKLILSNQRTFITNLTVVIISFIINILLLYALSNGLIKSDNPKLGFIFNNLDRNIFFWIFYFLFGGFVGLYYEKLKVFVGKLVLPLLFLVAVSMYYVYSEVANINSAFTENNYTLSAQVTAPLKPFTLILCTMLIILLFYTATRLPSKSPRLTSMFATSGRYALGAYFIHAFILSLSNDYVLNNLSSVTIQTIISFLLCSSISIYISYLLNKAKTPVGRIFTGNMD